MHNKDTIALVSGGGGFIGSHLVDILLKQGYEVRVIDNFSTGRESNLKKHYNNSKLKIEKIDINSLEKENKIFKDVNLVFHLAGIGEIVPSIEEPLSYISTNVIGTTKILEASQNNLVNKFIYAASSSCYGSATTPTNEDHPIQTEYPYALSKYLGEQTSLHWCKVYKLPVLSMRIFNAYGPRVRTTGSYGAVFGVFLKQKLSNKPLTIVGNGKQKRDFLYVTDVANAFYKAAISEYKNEIFNLGGGNPKTILYLADLISTEKVFIPERPGEPDCTWANISKITKNLGWEPEVSFEKGVQTMLDNINDWYDAPLWNEENIKEATKSWFKYLGK